MVPPTSGRASGGVCGAPGKIGSTSRLEGSSEGGASCGEHHSLPTSSYTASYFLTNVCSGHTLQPEHSIVSGIVRSSANMPNEIRDIRTVDETSFPYVFEQNVAVELKAGKGLVRCNVYRPKTSAPVPVLVTYGPYGKDIHYKE